MFALAVPGCGDGGDSPSSEVAAYDVKATTTMTAAEPPITKSEFVRRINRICRQAWATVLENWVRYTGRQEKTESADERFADAVQLSLLAGLDFHIFDNFRILGSPPGEETEIERIIRPFQAAVELGWEERWRASSIADIAAYFATFNERARRYGLDDCLVDEPHLRPIESQPLEEDVLPRVGQRTISPMAHWGSP